MEGNATAQDLHAYEEIGAQIGRLLEKKQWAYGHAFDHMDEILKIFFPVESLARSILSSWPLFGCSTNYFRTTSGKDDRTKIPGRTLPATQFS